ncbi:MAG: hypothetical protein K0U93_04685 [Gammaproteobacteria bacterium]|nr:hypothetical protein [Gammaproteobacteria bacterium]
MRRRQLPVQLKNLDWYKYIRRYFWDDETTPYLVPISKLHRKQADNEIFAYTLFVGILFAAVCMFSISGTAPYGKSFGASFFAFVVVCAAMVLGMTKHPHAAMVTGLAPVGAWIYLFSMNLRSDLHWGDQLFIVLFSLVWLRYALRIINMAKSYPDFPEPPPEPPGPPPRL